MPLLHRKLFVPDPPPDDLDPSEEVFHCTLTNEIFRDYELFYERTILCNSLVWSCSITNRPNLTYQEAVDCEKSAKKRLLRFPISLQKPILFLVGLCHRSRIQSLNEDIFYFVKERFFVGEDVEAIIGNEGKRSACRIMKVIPWTSALNGHGNGIAASKESSDDEDDIPLSSYQRPKHFEATDIQYLVKKLKKENVTEVISLSKIRRKQGTFTREYCKLFLKANCTKPNGLATKTYVVKAKVQNQLNLKALKWEDIFVGPTPVFAEVSPKSMKTKKVAGTEQGKSKSGSKDHHLIRQAKETEKEERRKERENSKKKKLEEIERMKEEVRVDKERKRKEREDEMIKMKVEREKIRNQKLEEKKRLAEYLKEWSRPRDDLDCDDLKDLPTPKEIQCRVPPSMFGDLLSLVEFFNAFSDLFEVKEQFPKGVSLELLSDAVMSNDHDGPLCDLFFLFISNLFRSHSEEEESFEKILVEPGDKELASRLDGEVSEEILQAFGTLAATWSSAYQGFPLNKIEVDSYTLSEVLRIYLISSATRPRSVDRQWRYQHRGGYSLCDDTPLRLCLDRPDIIHKLSTTAVYDLPPEDKVSLLMCLAHHLLGFVTPRDFLDETWEKITQARNAYREDKAAEKRREKESAAERWKWKCEQMNLEKAARNKELEERLKRIEQGLPPEPEEEEMQRKLRKRKQPGDSDEPRLYTAEEKEKRLRVFDDDELVAKDAWKYRESKHQEEIAKHYSSFRSSVLGQDRFFRRYWVLNTAPCLFVEEFVDAELTPDVISVRAMQKKAPAFMRDVTGRSGCSTPGLSDSSAGGTPVGFAGPKVLYQSKPIPIDLNMSSDGAHQHNAIVHSASNGMGLHAINQADARHCEQTQRFTQGTQHRWFVFTSTEEIDNLVSSLNTRGFRESKLLKRITSQKDYILKLIQKTSNLVDVNKLLASALEKSDVSPASGNHKPKEETLEKILQDQILDLEQRIWAGTLGTAQVGDREAWRSSIEAGVEYEGKTNLEFPEEQVTEKGSELISEPYLSFPITEPSSIFNRQTSTDHEAMDVTESTSVRYLAVGLFITERGIDRKFIKQPLGCAQDETRAIRAKGTENENSPNAINRWEKSLLQCTSLSQIFLHLSTLERCIMWSKSAANAKCKICRRKGDAEKMLLCDSCNRGYHMYCLKPAIKSVPAGDWFCPSCKPKSSRISPRKVVRTKSFSQDESSEEEEEDEEEEEEESGSDHEDSISSMDYAPRKSLQYKIPQKPQKKGQKTAPSSSSISSKSKSSEAKHHRSTRRSDEAERPTASGSHRRRSQGVWKDLASCQEILSDVLKNKDSWPFLEPVNKKLVPDYYDIIKKPMDLCKVQRKMKEVQYATSAEFISDMDLIFSNCHLYNEARSAVAKAATHLQAYFDSKLQNAGLSHHRNPTNPNKKRRGS